MARLFRFDRRAAWLYNPLLIERSFEEREAERLRFSTKLGYLILLILSVIALWLLIRPPSDEEVTTKEQSAPASAVDTSVERFSGGCPPENAAIEGDATANDTPQKIDPKLLDLMQEEVEGQDETHMVVQSRAFCLFTDDGRVKGVLNSCYMQVGQGCANPINALNFWMNRQGIDVEVICQIEWVWSDPPCEPPDDIEEAPAEEEQEPEDPLEGDGPFA